MGLKRFPLLAGIIAVIAAAGTPATRAATVPALPDEAAYEAPLDVDRSAAAAPAADPLDDFIATPAVDDPTSDVIDAHRDDDALLLMMSDLRADTFTMPSSFEGGALTGGSTPSAPSHVYALSPVPEHVLIPLPPAAWTGLAALAGLGLFGMTKHVRRFVR